MNLNIATILFTYNRPEHTKKTLNALSANTILPSKLYIFQDGKKPNTDLDKWNEVNECINSVNWCNKEIIVSSKNKGLADSIVDGINYVFERHEAVIVLEDDIVTHPQFMEYMISSLNKYYEDKRVYNINADADNVEVSPNGTDAYFTGRSSSWGWGTWKDRWQYFDRDYRIVAKLKQDEKLNEQFHLWASDVESYLIGNVTGQCNSWASFWVLNIIRGGGYCLTPYRGFVDNIGFDGTGVHCGVSDVKLKCRSFDERSSFVLPDKVEFPKDYKIAYGDYFRWIPAETKFRCYNKILLQFLELKSLSDIADYLLDKEKVSTVAIYGRGNICKLLLKAFDKKIKVSAIIESNPQLTEYMTYPVRAVSNIPSETQLVICIPVYDMERIQEKINPYAFCPIIGIDKLLQKLLDE